MYRLLVIPPMGTMSTRTHNNGQSMYLWIPEQVPGQRGCDNASWYFEVLDKVNDGVSRALVTSVAPCLRDV